MLIVIVLGASNNLDRNKSSVLQKCLEEIVNQCPENIKVFVSTRSFPAIEGPGIEIRVENNGDDVQAFIKQTLQKQIRDNALLMRKVPPELRVKIENTLANYACNMFLYANLLLDRICDRNSNSDAESIGSALIAAIGSGNVNAIWALVEKKAYPHLRSKNHGLPLEKPAGLGEAYKETITKSRSFNPLCYYLIRQSERCSQVGRPRRKYESNWYDSTLLLAIITYDCLELREEVPECAREGILNVQIDKQANNGRTAVIEACVMDRPMVMQHLLDACTDYTITGHSSGITLDLTNNALG